MSHDEQGPGGLPTSPSMRDCECNLTNESQCALHCALDGGSRQSEALHIGNLGGQPIQSFPPDNPSSRQQQTYGSHDESREQPQTYQASIPVVAVPSFRHRYSAVTGDEGFQNLGDLGQAPTSVGHNYHQIKGGKAKSTQMLGDVSGSDGVQCFLAALKNHKRGSRNQEDDGDRGL